MPPIARTSTIFAAKRMVAELKTQLAEVKKLGGIDPDVIQGHEQTLEEIDIDLDLKPIPDEKLSKLLEHIGRMADRMMHLWIARDSKLALSDRGSK